MCNVFKCDIAKYIGITSGKKNKKTKYTNTQTKNNLWEKSYFKKNTP